MNNKVYQRRIKLNEKEIKEAEKRRLKYRIIECSIAVTALLSSSCSYACYRKAPVDGAIFYTVSPSETQIVPDANNYYFDEPVELPNGRYITEDGINKEYFMRGYKDYENQTLHPYLNVSLLTTASELNTNYMALSQRVDLEDGNYVYAKTVPSKKERTKDIGIMASSAIATLASVAIFQNKIANEETYKSSLKRRNRKLKKLLRK